MAGPESVSVIIAAYDYARFLPAAIESALAQEGVRREVIVVDDGSTDATPAVLERFAGRIVAVSQENRGLCAARNAGLARAGGSCVVFLDADDLLPPGVLDVQLRALQAAPQRAVAVCRNFFFESADAAGRPQPAGQWRLFRAALDVHLCHFNIAPPHAFLVRREAVERAGGFDTGLAACEDHDLWLRLAAAGQAPLANPAVAVAYRRHPGSMSRNLDRQHAHDALLHARVAALLAQNPAFPATASREGALACLAGCLLTYGRLRQRLPDAAAGLAAPIGETAGRLARSGPFTPRDPRTLEYFLLRLSLSLRDLGECAVVSPVREALSCVIPERMPALAALSARELRAALERLTATLVF